MNNELSENELRIQKIVENYVSEFVLSDDNTEIIFWEELYNLEKDDVDFDIIKTKVENMLKLMNEEYKKGSKSFALLQERDFHTDIWFKI